MSLPSASQAAMPSHGGSSHAHQEASNHSATAAAADDCLPSKPPPKSALHRIDNPSNRQVTFTKRRNALLRKAYELSVLCDAEVATIIFSSTGRVSEFSSPSMSKIIKRYEDLQPQTSNKIMLQEREYWKHESLQLKKQVDYINDVQSYMMGGDVMNLSMSELQKIESQLEVTMNKIRVKKMELLEIQTHEMINKGNMLWRENNLLKKKLTEMVHSSDENPTSGEMSGSSKTSELVNDPPLKEVLDTELRLGQA